MKLLVACALCLIPIFIGPSLGAEETRVVTTTIGKVEGALSDFGKYYEFLGLRYAVPVLFKSPVEPPSFSGVFIANIRHVACAQPNNSRPFTLPSTSQDCLVLNVYMPANATGKSSLPVMVFIHGGEFDHGSSTPAFYGPRYLVSRDVIVVTLNYRLNIYGFLNLGLKEAPGNAGLKDIRAALRWVNSNIRNFGGNPENVTVFGHGAGGTAAVYLTMSPTTNGLFNRIIVESGTVFNKYSYDPSPLDTALVVARALDSKAETPQELLKLFYDTPVEKMMEALQTIPHSLEMFAPSLEELYDDEEPFLIDTPYNILATGLSHPSFNPVPAIIGHTTSEALVNMMDADELKQRYESVIKGDLSTFLHRSLIPSTTKDVAKFLRVMKDTYIGNRTDYSGVVGGLFNFDMDFLYIGPTNLLADLYTNSSKLPVYSYIFDHIGGRNLGRQLLGMNSTMAGTTHYDELYYLMELESRPLPMSEEDALVVGYMSTLWTNFAKYGTPTYPASASSDGVWLEHPSVLSISSKPMFVTPMVQNRSLFWRSFYFQYGSDIRRA